MLHNVSGSHHRIAIIDNSALTWRGTFHIREELQGESIRSHGGDGISAGRCAADLHLIHLPFLKTGIQGIHGIARGYYTQQDLEVLHAFMQESLKERLGFGFDKIYFCPHAPQEQCTCRKPQSGMITRACKDFAIDLAHSVLIGDKITDMQCAQNAGVAGKFLLNCGEMLAQDLLDCNVQSVQSLAQIQNLLAQSVARSGVSGDSLSMSDTQILQKQNLH